MSKLPEQRKSPEELAALRDQLGIRKLAPTPEASAPLHKERPATIPEDIATVSVAARLMPATPLKIRPDVPEVLPAVLDEETGLPVKRHSADELATMRLRGQFETQDEALRLPIRRERTTSVICGYLLTLAAAVPIYHKLPVALPLVMSLIALAYGAFLFFRRPYSRHHGAFIAILVMFVLIYAALQYIPKLQNAT